jgi:cytochrome c peroxidase
MSLRAGLLSACACLLALAQATCTRPAQTREPVEQPAAASVRSEGEPLSPIPASVKLNPDKVALGSLIFNDPQLSHDDSVSCATCHSLSTGGVDRLPRSIGIGGQHGGRNAPTVFNSALNFRQFWDGRAATLEDQIDGPIAQPLEMGSNWPEIIQKLRRAPELEGKFAALYSDGLTPTSVKNAVATFERSLNTPNSRFDRFLLGDTTALTMQEIEGYHTFKSFGCVSCHQGANVGGNMYQRLGVMEPLGPNLSLANDEGRFVLTGDPSDEHVFKVPSLRNVALTAPYFHDGSASTLEGAVLIMGRYQLGRQLTASEVGLLVTFLKTLTGEYEGQPLQ